MKDNIFKPLTHMDRTGTDENLTSRFQRRETEPLNDSVFENLDTDPTNPQEGWDAEGTAADTKEQYRDVYGDGLEANGCYCPVDDDTDGPVVYQETVLIEFYDDTDENSKEQR